MAAPVWILSVDLQTKTATFQSGMADAAKSARGAFGDIKSGASEMGASTNYSMMEARHGVMLLTEEFGFHLPRALTSFIASIGPVGAAMQAAFPFLAIIVGATLLIQHLEKLQEAGEKLTQDQVKFGTTVNNVFNALDQKILQAQIRADELNHNHLKALDDQLKAIDRESMDELVKSFAEIEKASDEVMRGMESHWYTFGTGSEGAKHALDDFTLHYNALMAAGKEDQASGLLHGTEQQARNVLQLLQQAQINTTHTGDGANSPGSYARFEEAKNKLRELGVNLENDTEATLQRQVDAQQQLVNTMDDYVGAEERVAALKKLEGGNAKTADAQADARYEKEKQKEVAAAQREGMAAYLSELFQAHKEQVTAVEQGEKETIEATKEGTAGRLSALNEAMLQERQMGLSDSAFYRQLQLQEIETQRQMDEESGKLTDEMLRQKITALREIALEEARHSEAMDKIQTPKNTDDFSEKRTQLADEYQAKHTELAQELADARQMGTQRVAQEQRINDQMAALDKKYQDQKAELAAEEAQKEKQASIEVADAFGQSMLRVMEGHERMRKMAEGAFESIISNSLRAALMEVAHEKTAQLAHAEAAAAAAWHAMSNIPVVGPALGAVAAAATFAGAMAFEQGGIVPGYGNMDTVPAMLTPGETVIPKGLSESLMSAARGGSSQPGHTYHVHVRPTYHVNTIDGDGMQDVLEKHSDQLTRHVQNTLRKMNH